MTPSNTPRLDLRMRLKFLRDQLDKSEAEPYRKQRKERNDRAFERMMDDVLFDTYMDGAGDR